MMKTIEVIIVPNAKVSEMVGMVGNRIKIKVAAPPIEGRANKELIKFLARHFKLHRSQISIVKGEKTRFKTIAINDESGK